MIKAVLLFIVGFAATWLTVHYCGAWAGIVPAKMYPREQPKDSTIAYRRFWDDVDYSTFYHELDDGLRGRLRTADVVIMGNSRVQFGLDEKLFRDHFRARGQKVFNLGFAWAQTSAWSHILMEKYRLNASWILVNADPFFANGLAFPVPQTMATTRLRASHQLFEAGMSIQVREQLAEWKVPRLRAFNLFGDNDSAVYRDQVSGWWKLKSFPYYFSTSHGPPVTDVLESDALKTVDWLAVHKFVGLMKGRGINAVLINVPHIRIAESARAVTRKMSEVTGMPYLEVDETDLHTFDGSHLSHDSALLYSSRLLAELDKLMAQTPAISR